MLAASTAVESRCVTIRRRSQPQQTRPAIAVRAILGPVAAGRGPSPAAALQSGSGPAEPAAARQNPLRHGTDARGVASLGTNACSIARVRPPPKFRFAASAHPSVGHASLLEG